MALSTSSWAWRVPGATLDELSDALDIAGLQPDGVSEERGVASAWFGTRPTQGMPLGGTWEEVATADWSERWKEGLEPITVGSISVLPPWLAPDGPDLAADRPVIVIEPGMAFGTGHHETTTACLLALQDLDLTGRRVADIGTGTGVLALAAIALGADHVVAVDVDPEAVEVAVANIAEHGVTSIEVRLGSCEAVGDAADVVVANIITDKLLALAPALVGLTRPGGWLVCSGVAVDRTAEAVEAFAGAGIEMAAQPGREWTVLRGRR